MVEGVAEIARGSSASSLCAAMETLIADGLKDQHPWQMIVTVTKPGECLICGIVRFIAKSHSRSAFVFYSTE